MEETLSEVLYTLRDGPDRRGPGQGLRTLVREMVSEGRAAPAAARNHGSGSGCRGRTAPPVDRDESTLRIHMQRRTS